jgi:hypothetical protein
VRETYFVVSVRLRKPVLPLSLWIEVICLNRDIQWDVGYKFCETSLVSAFINLDSVRRSRFSYSDADILRIFLNCHHFHILTFVNK